MIPPILYVEDEPNDVFFLELAFKRAGIKSPLRIAPDGQQAEAYLLGEGEYADRKKHPLPRLVILDINLPLKNGIEVLETIRGHPALRSLPVIILSSSAHDSEVQRAELLGIESYKVKPSNPTELAAWVATTLTEWAC